MIQDEIGSHGGLALPQVLHNEREDVLSPAVHQQQVTDEPTQLVEGDESLEHELVSVAARALVRLKVELLDKLVLLEPSDYID